ncbi:MAG TPA: tetratricopeptide repeat protein [Candidatus Acidoferrum sp.]|nr:tetratricopeptide repeat protein [Candidatus Acidoferrum sp.]
MGSPFPTARISAFLLALALIAPAVFAQQQAAAPTAASPSLQRIFVVLPFENASGSTRLDWLGEGLEELTIQRLSAAGEHVFSHAGRAAELERYGLPATSKYSRATMLRIAEDLDADFVIFGRYTANNNSLTVEMRTLSTNPTALRPALQETGPLDALMNLHTRLLWRSLSANVRNYSLSLDEFTKRQRPLRLDAFEQYIRGLLSIDDEAKLRQLHEAARLEPDWPDPQFALGEAYYARRDYGAALAWFFKVPKQHDRYIEALFFSGVCRLQLNQPDHAEEVFNSLLEALRNSPAAGVDLPEILNNLALARVRQGKAAEAQADLRHAAELDPGEDDYPFNQGLVALQNKDAAAAADHFREAAEREPDSAEDRALLILALEKAGKKPEAEQEREEAKEAFGPSGLPAIALDPKNETVTKLQRIKTELDVTSLRGENESADTPAGVAAASASNDTPAARIRRGRQELSLGHIDVAEREFRAVLDADPANAAAHRGLGEIDHRQGKMDDAVKELQVSLDARDSAEVRTILARIYLEQKKPDLARAEVEKALKLAPNYAEAKQLLEHLQNSKAPEKKPGGGAQ